MLTRALLFSGNTIKLKLTTLVSLVCLIATRPTIASVDFAYLLLVSDDANIRAYWHTRSETNNARMELWRAPASGDSFTLVVSQQGAGNHSGDLQYYHRDQPLDRGATYRYVVTAIDFDSVEEVVSDTLFQSTIPLRFSDVYFYPACPNGYEVKWTVAYEVNVLDYIIVRGPWQTCHDTIAYVPALGNSDSSLSYSFWDSTTSPTAYAYCLYARRTDFSIYRPNWIIFPDEPESYVVLNQYSVTSSATGPTVSWVTSWEWNVRCYQIVRMFLADSTQVLLTSVPANNVNGQFSHEFVDEDVSTVGLYNYMLYYTTIFDTARFLADTTVLVVPNSVSVIPTPSHFAFSSYPNPFNPTTNISLSVPQTARTEIQIFDITGRKVEQLHDGTLERGEHNFTFDGANLSTGLYFARVQSGGFFGTQKLLLLK